MESSRGRRVEKRVYEESLEDEDAGLTHLKKPRLPGLARFVVQFLCISNASSSQFIGSVHGHSWIALFSFEFVFMVLKYW